MGSAVIDQAASILERRFLKNALLPVMLLLPAIAAPWLIASGELRHAAHAWESQSSTMKLVELAAYLAVVWFLAAILASQWGNIVRLFEGYPIQRLSWLAGMGVTWHKSRHTMLMNDKAAPERLYLEYPISPNELLPTRLGNIFRSAERYPLERYNADAVTTWMRLYRVMPPEAVNDVEAALARVEFLLVLTLWWTVFAAVALGSLSAAAASPVVVIVIFGGGIGLAHASYVSAVGAARDYAEHLRASFDLYRLDLLRQLKVALPADNFDERTQWKEVYDLTVKGAANTGWPYKEPSNELVVTLRPAPPVPPIPPAERRS